MGLMGPSHSSAASISATSSGRNGGAPGWLRSSSGGPCAGLKVAGETRKDGHIRGSCAKERG